MNIRGRIKRLERTTQAIELPAATRQDAMDWSARFRAHDPANGVLWDEIRAWGCRYHMDYIYAERGDDVHAGECMKSLYWMVSGAVRSGKSGCRDGFECAPDLLRRFACALREYQRDRRDRFPLEAHLIDWLADEKAEEFLNLINLHCRLGERLVVNMADPEVAAFPARYAARVHS